MKVLKENEIIINEEPVILHVGLTQNEIDVLLNIFEHIAGSPHNSNRKYIDLMAIGLEPYRKNYDKGFYKEGFIGFNHNDK